MTVLVTGSSGHLGEALMRTLRANGRAAVGLDIIPGRYRLLAIDGGWELAWADPNVLARFLKKSIPIQIRANDRLKQTIEAQSR